MQPAKVILSLLMFAGTAVYAAPEASVSVKKSDKAVELKVLPPPGTHLNYDGPWRLEIQGALPLVNKSGVFGLDTFDKTTEKFSLPLERKAAVADKSQYTLTYFFCAQDNSWCKRAQAKGDL